MSPGAGSQRRSSCFARRFPRAVVGARLLNRQTIGFDPIFLLSTDARDRITGLAFVYYFSDLDYGYLQYITSDPRKPARGIGVALYETLRELGGARRARALSRRAARRGRQAQGPFAARHQ